MSTEPTECADEAGTSSAEPTTPNEVVCPPIGPEEESVDLPYRISIEHCYSRLVPFRRSPPPCTLTADASFPTSVLFENCVKDKTLLQNIDRKWAGQTPNKVDHTSTVSNGLAETSSVHDVAGSDDVDVDVVTVDQRAELPYDEKKVGSIMTECSRHINLVKVPAENSDIFLSRVIQEASYQRKVLLRRLVEILEADYLARLSFANVSREPIKRRLSTDKAARQFRKTLADAHWDTKLIRFCHETLLQGLNKDLLPIYLDILQVLKAKCPVLVENMIHSSAGMVGNEAFGLLLKRPWNPVVGLYASEKLVKFDPAPLFITLPFSTTGLGGRRMRMLQNHLGAFGKVNPIILPEKLMDLSRSTSLEDVSSAMMSVSIARVQELQAQYPTRPIVLVAFSVSGRVAAKVAELENVSCIVSVGLPVHGIDTTWTVDCDPFQGSTTPTVFVVGSESSVGSIKYLEELRSSMKCPTSLVVVGGGDDLVRLSAEDKMNESVCQSIVDRCFLDKVYDFLVYILPCSYPEDHTRLARKRKGSHTDEIGSAYLTPAMAQSPIRLSSPVDDDAKNLNANNSNPSHKYMKHNGSRGSSVVSNRSTPSPTLLLSRRYSEAKKKAVNGTQKLNRPRSKSMSDTVKKPAPLVRMGSCGTDEAASSGSFSTLTGSLLALNSNANNSTLSPPGFLTIPQAHIRPLPITPPRNPYADDVHGARLDPKTIKQLQKGR